MPDQTIPRLLSRLPTESIDRMAAAPMTTVRPGSRPMQASLDEIDARPLPSIPTAGGDLDLAAVIGEGGMGRVVLAHQRSLGREVAVKFLLPNRRSREAEAALLTEGRFAGSLEHPNIVPVHALGRDESGSPVLVMKRVEGTSWRERLRGDTVERDLEILIQVCNAVHFAHTRGVIHRDIKPDNVMLGEFGEVYLVDWGVALRLSERQGATELAGTPGYLAPEMLAGGIDLSPRTDVYLLGATLHEILTGQPPHRGADLPEILASVMSPDVPDFGADAPPALAAICKRALDPVPQLRYFSAADLRDALVAFLRHRGSERLADQAIERLDEARRAEASALRRRLLVESQFGLRQALREWADNDVAKSALAECIAELGRLELAEGNRGAAEHLVAELAEPPADLTAGLVALAGRIAADQAARVRLEGIDHEQDFGVSRRARLVIAIVLLVLNLLSAAIAVLTGKTSFTARELAFNQTGVVIIGLVMGFVSRRALLRNRVNRQIVLAILAVGVALVVLVWLGTWSGQPTPETLEHEMIVLGLAMALLGLTVVGWLLPLAPVNFVCAAVATAHPALAPWLWLMVTSLPLAGMIIAWWRPRAEGS